MRFWLHLANWLGIKLPELPGEPIRARNSAVPYELSAGEVVVRFIYSQRRMNKSYTRPMPDAFYPPPDDQLSVVHSTGLQDREIWEIGRLHALGGQPGRDKISGRADVPVKAFADRKLHAIRDDDPFERHTSVVGWPRSTNADDRKQKLLAVCLELSQDPEIKLVIPGSPIIRAIDLEPEAG